MYDPIKETLEALAKAADLLAKAPKRPGLVPVKKAVRRKGKTYQQTYYVRPGEGPKGKRGPQPEFTSASSVNDVIRSVFREHRVRWDRFTPPLYAFEHDGRIYLADHNESFPLEPHELNERAIRKIVEEWLDAVSG